MMEDFTMEFKENTDFDLIGLGEVMLRLSPPNKEKISQSETFEKNAGGSELNVVSGGGNARYSFGDSYKIARKQDGTFYKK